MAKKRGGAKKSKNPERSQLEEQLQLQRKCKPAVVAEDAEYVPTRAKRGKRRIRAKDTVDEYIKQESPKWGEEYQDAESAVRAFYAWLRNEN